MSALAHYADSSRTSREVREVPQPDMLRDEPVDRRSNRKTASSAAFLNIASDSGCDAPSARSLTLRFFSHRRLKLLDILRRQLRAVDLDRQLVQLGGQREWWLVVGIVHAGQRVGADVEALVPL